MPEPALRLLSIVGFQCAMEKGSNLWSAATSVILGDDKGIVIRAQKKNTDTENRTRAKMIQYMP
ncbi:MAG TPA: hypothetical protein VF906_04240 [Candidatus Bathyarchaeia archaeon]